MDERQESQKDKIKKQVEINKSRSLDGTKLGSRNDTVNRFGVLGKDKSKSDDKSNIKSRIDASKARNLTQNSNQQYIPNFGDNLGSVSDDSESDYLDIDNVSNKVSNTVTGVSNTASNVKNVSKGAKKLIGGTQKTSDITANAASNVVKKTGNALSKPLQGATKAIGNISKAAVESLSKLFAFLASVFGVPLLVIVALFTLILFIIVIIHIMVSSYGTKFGIDSTNIEEVLRNEEFMEGLTREEIEDIMDQAETCKLTWWDHVRNFFGSPDLENPCVIRNVIREKIENREKSDSQYRHGHSVDVKTQGELAPGYLFSTLYYAFDTQNYDENGDLYIPPVMSGHTNYNDDGEIIDTIVISDVDAITTLLNTKKPDTELPIYKMGDVEKLLDNYIFFEDHSHDMYGSNGYKYGMPYWLYEYIIVDYDEDNNPIWDWACVENNPETFYTDSLKFKLYLRYGEEVMNEYEYDKNLNLQWQKTDGTCRNYSGLIKDYNGDIYNSTISMSSPPSMTKYETKAEPDSEGNDNASITISGGTYGYDSGFIYNTYPRYDDNYITVPREYSYKIDKEIERIIMTIDSRQDYVNYILGYDSSVSQYIAGIGSGNYNYNGGAKCKYDFDGVEISDIKVRLLTGYYGVTEGNRYQPINGQELIDFEDYITGVVYAELEDGSPESWRTEAIAARSWVLNRTKVMNHATLKQENGEWILSIASSEDDQVYCDINKGCYYQCDGYGTTTFTAGTEPQGANCKLWKSGYENGSDYSKNNIGELKQAVKEVAGMLLIDDKGNPVNVSYANVTHNKWKEMALGTWVDEYGNKHDKMDYIEILRTTYGGNYQVSTPDCSFGVTGEWSSWKQWSEEWGNIKISSSGSTLARIGCYMTCHAMVIAQGANNILIPNFNPGTFAEYLKTNGGFDSSGNLYPDKAMDLAVGAGNWESTQVYLRGSMQVKAATLANLLEEGYSVILRVKSPQSNAINGDGDQHYVVVTGISGSEIYIADPGYNVSKVSDKYLNEGLTWAKGIKFK